MMSEEAQDAWEMFRISPELTCTCDEFHICQQCLKDECDLNSFECQSYEG